MKKIHFWLLNVCFISQVWAGVTNTTLPETGKSNSTKEVRTEESEESDIIFSSASALTANVDYTEYSVTSGLLTSNSLEVGQFTIRDGGATSPDADVLPTVLNEITFKVINNENIAAIALFDGGNNIAEITDVGVNTLFSGLALTAADDATKDFKIRVTFKSQVTDNDRIDLSVIEVVADRESSQFADDDAGGAETPTTGDDNRIEVTANSLLFTQQPTDGNVLEILQPSPIVIAADINGNQDLDVNASINIFAQGALNFVAPELPSIMTNGEAILDNILFDGEETNINLRVFDFAAARTGLSVSFNINGPIFPLAQQNFDTQTGWSYTSDTAFRTNNTSPIGVWSGTEGYFGDIAVGDVSPLSNSLFSNTMFGENNLNTTANPYATITFADIDVNGITNLKINFDWEVVGYTDDDNDIQYRLVLDGTPQSTWVDVFDGNGDINDAQGRANILIADGSNTVGLEVRLRNNRAEGYAGFDNFRLVSEFSGRIYTEASEWNGQNNVPDDTPESASENALIFSGTYSVENDAKINNLFVNDGATVFIDFGKSLTVNNVFNTGNIELNSISNNYSSLIVSGTVANTVAYDRHVNTVTTPEARGNDLISAPVTNASQTFEALQLANPGIIPVINTGDVDAFLFGPFDRDSNTYVNYTAADNSAPLTIGTGYRTASSTPDGSNFKFVGDVETGSVTVPSPIGSSSIFNLIGNPYPSYVRLDEFLAVNNSEFDASRPGLYTYIGNFTTGFTILNQAFSDANPEALIAPGQGFFVSSKAGGSLITFNPNMRSIGTSDDFVIGRDGANTNLANMNIHLTKGNLTAKTALYFNDNASLGMDSGYDSALFSAVTPGFAIYSHLVENNTGLDLAVQSVNFAALDNVTIPLGIHITQGEQVTVSLGDHNIPERSSVILEDNMYNTFTDLKTNDYNFTPTTTLTDTGRFYLHLSPETLSTSENILNGIEIFTARDTKELIIKGRLDQDTALTIFDIQGRQVTADILKPNETEYRLSVSSLERGIYVVELTSASQTRTQKILIE